MPKRKKPAAPVASAAAAAAADAAPVEGDSKKPEDGGGGGGGGGGAGGGGESATRNAKHQKTTDPFAPLGPIPLEECKRSIEDDATTEWRKHMLDSNHIAPTGWRKRMLASNHIVFVALREHFPIEAIMGVFADFLPQGELVGKPTDLAEMLTTFTSDVADYKDLSGPVRPSLLASKGGILSRVALFVQNLWNPDSDDEGTNNERRISARIMELAVTARLLQNGNDRHFVWMMDVTARRRPIDSTVSYIFCPACGFEIDEYGPHVDCPQIILNAVPFASAARWALEGVYFTMPSRRQIIEEIKRICLPDIFEARVCDPFGVRIPLLDDYDDDWVQAMMPSYVPASPTYEPTSPSYNPNSPSYSPKSSV